MSKVQIIITFYSTSRYREDLKNIGNPYFEGLAIRIEIKIMRMLLTPKPLFCFTFIHFEGFVSSKMYVYDDVIYTSKVSFLVGDVPRFIYLSSGLRFNTSVC